MLRKIVICLPLTVFLLTGAQAQPGKIPRIGYVRVLGVPSTPAPNVEAFRQGLRDLGYVEGENIVIEFRYAEESRTVSQGL